MKIGNNINFMKKFLLNLLIPIVTFAFGIGIYRNSTPNVSLETISENTFFYDGLNVEIESYAQLWNADDDELFLKDYNNKTELLTHLKFSENQVLPSNLTQKLREDYTENKFKRIKVLVSGKIKDDCNPIRENGTISFGCCFGKSMFIKVDKITTLAPIEDFVRPE